MKSLSIKLPLPVALSMDERAQLNPEFVTRFITNHVYDFQGQPAKAEKEQTFSYTLKVPAQLHTDIKAAAAKLNLPINEFIRQMFVVYYNFS